MAGERYGEWAFLAGVLLALALGLLQGLGVEFGNQQLLNLLLVVLGLVVGLTTVTSKETDSFLIASIALLSVGAAGLSGFEKTISDVIVYALVNLRSFVAPAALVVALKSIYKLASTR
ncbi:MAG: hypothetical protein QXJ06_02465 [Candidatus Aenigmatarchaeota archaeon]